MGRPPSGPAPATWLDEADPFRAASETLIAAGIDVTAWIVLTHNTRLGEAHPDVAVVNCFGDSYSHTLCPRWLEVREYAATLAVEAVRDTDITGVLLEAWAQRGVAHGSLHDKTAGAWSPAAMRLLSICCCAACRLAWHDRGLDPSSVAGSLRDAVRYDRNLPEDILEHLLAVRLEAAAILLADVVDAVTGTHPTRPVSVFGDPDPWATMPIAAVGRHASTVVVPAWSTDPARTGSAPWPRRAGGEGPVMVVEEGLRAGPQGGVVGD